MLVLRDLERPSRRRDRRASLGAQEQAVPGLVGTARLRLHGGAAAARDRCCLPGPAARAVGLCRRHAGGRGARRARASHHRLRELPRRPVRTARGRVALSRRCPCRSRPAISDRASALRSARSACRRASTAAAEPVAGGGRKTAVAVAMGALALVGVGVTIAAARDDDGSAKPAPAPAPVSPQPQAQPSAPVSDSAVAIGAVSLPVTRPRRPPPVLHHQRTGTRRRAHAHAPAQRAARPTVAQQLGLGKSFAPEGPPIVASPPAPTPVTTPKPKPTPVHDIPVDVLPPNPPPTAAQAASQTSPDPPPQPEAPPPEQTTST